MACSSSRDRERSTLFSSEKGGLQSVPFSHDHEKQIFDYAAGDKGRVGLETNCENLMENLDDLTDEQLDELLWDALDVNQRLKSFERKRIMQSHGENFAHEMAPEEHESGTRSMAKRTHFLPPLEQTQTSLVMRVPAVKGTKPINSVGRQNKTSVM